MQMIANGVWQLGGFPRDFFNVYLVEDVLIDTATRWARRRLLRQLEGRAVRLVALTHCHPDHQGSAEALCRHFDVPLACHEADMPAVEGRRPMLPDNRLLRLARRLWAGPPCSVGRLLEAGDIVAGFRVVHAPGHTPGHVLFFREADGVCIAGDLLANIHFLTGRAGLREPPTLFSADAAMNRRSVQLLCDLKPRVVCFGHGPPLRTPELLHQWATERGRSLVPVMAPALT
jgi:glyoxylase-like metal-dependent hydrolase (beta-lactamase superfamily II)